MSTAGADRAAFHFRAETGEVRAVLRRAVARFARQITAEDAGALELVLAEVLNNVVEHAYAHRPAGEIRLSLWRAPARLHCLVEDLGRALPGLSPPDDDLPGDGTPDRCPPDDCARTCACRVRDLAEGGWGWSLIRALTEDLGYERTGKANRLRFAVPLASP
ncbi:MAG: ATP-binding protein [Proteobacteria bacterium]|nr:ATP-binding protein [Pseudomonadota bacterium]MBS0574712.1 ATP-binding protein [Pseudomonadota bacterium]